jgi:hypothetical protein
MSNSDQRNYIAATGCVDCPVGTYQDKMGSTRCKPCPKGFFNNEKGKAVCSPCQPGSFASKEGAVSCDPAPEGSYAQSPPDTLGIPMHQKGISKPYPCPYGSFSIRPGAYACVACPVGTSTNITGNVSPSNCVPCPFGVNALTYRCLDDNSHLNDLCWNSGQLLSLNSSIVVQDLFRLVYEMPIVGMDALMSNTINVIQQSSMSLARPDDVALGAQRLELAPALWLNATKHNLPACQAKLHSQIGSDTGTLINYQFGGGQFGKKWANARINWISYWRAYIRLLWE